MAQSHLLQICHGMLCILLFLSKNHSIFTLFGLVKDSVHGSLLSSVHDFVNAELKGVPPANIVTLEK